MARNLFLLLLLLASCEIKRQKEVEAVKVETFVVEPRTIPITYDYVGVTASSHPVEIRARIEGYISKIAYVEGSEVKKGDLLFVLDPGPFQAALDEAKANLTKQNAALENANINVDRLTTLYEQDAVSKKSLDDAIAEKNQVEGGLAIARARVETAELNLSYTQITSPISGLTAAANYREGTLINPASNSLLTTVSAIDPMWVNFSVSETEILKVKKEILEKKITYPIDNFEVKIRLPDGTYFSKMGYVNFASPTIDPKTGTLNVRAIFPNPKGELIPGLFVRAEVIGAKRVNAIYVPQKSVLQNARGSYVFVIDQDNKARLTQVETGDWYETFWIIDSGLKKGDIVVSEGVNKIQDGTLVEIEK